MRRPVLGGCGSVVTTDTGRTSFVLPGTTDLAPFDATRAERAVASGTWARTCCFVAEAR